MITRAIIVITNNCIKIDGTFTDNSAKGLVKKYKLKSKVKISTGKNSGEYVPETDTVTLRRSYPSIKEFLMTILHEIGHALDAKRLGVKKYIKKYTQAGTMAQYDGLDPHDDNKWEEKAERFAKKELSKWEKIQNLYLIQVLLP